MTKGSRYATAAAIAVTALVAALDLRFAVHAGGLWRDEAATARFATLPTFGEILGRLHLDNFPLLSLVAVRGWSAVAGPSDTSYRVFGLVVVLGVLAVLWLHGRWIGAPTIPWLGLVLFAANPVSIRALESIRPYGIGAALIVAAHALIWAAAVKPTAARLAAAAIAATLSVQTLYQNAILLAVVCIAASIAGGRGSRRRAFIPLAIGAVAALSLVPYLGFIERAQDWSVLNRGPVGLAHLISVLGSMVSAAGPLAAAAWTIALAAALVAGTRAWSRDDGRVLYGLLTLVGASGGYLLFLRVLSMPTQIWYYVLPAGLAAVSIDTIFATLESPPAARRAIAALLTLAVVAPAAWSGTAVRQTNADLVAATLRSSVTTADLVVVHPWYCAISLDRYYRGLAPVVTIPPLDDITIHRYDLLKKRMQEPDPIGPLLQRIESALAQGGRVWYVGDLELPPPGSEIPMPPPAPADWGWSEGAYMDAWSARTAGFLRERAREVREVPVATHGPVNPLETLPVYVFSGFRDGR